MARTDFYRIKFENGKITIMLFDKNNPIPHTRIKGSLKDKNVREAIKLLKEKYGSTFSHSFLDIFEIAEGYDKQIKEDFESISNEERKNGRI